MTDYSWLVSHHTLEPPNSSLLLQVDAAHASLCSAHPAKRRLLGGCDASPEELTALSHKLDRLMPCSPKHAAQHASIIGARCSGICPRQALCMLPPIPSYLPCLFTCRQSSHLLSQVILWLLGSLMTLIILCWWSSVLARATYLPGHMLCVECPYQHCAAPQFTMHKA